LKILIVAPAWLGDMVMAHALVQVLCAGYPDAEIHLLAPPSTHALAARMPGVRECHLLQAGHGDLALAERWRCARRLSAVKFDQAIVLPNSLKSALVPFWARIPKRTGWTGEMRLGLLNDRRALNRERYPLMIERFMALGLDEAVLPDIPYPKPLLRADADNARRLRDQHRLVATGSVAMCPGAQFGSAKRWPTEHFAQVATQLVARGHQVWLLGSESDRPICNEIESLVPKGIVNLAGDTSLLDVVDVLSLADQVISNDSGLMHVACALERPVVAIFGSSSPTFTPPLGDKAVVVSEQLECRPCFQRECPLGHLKCLRDLPPGRIMDALTTTAGLASGQNS
jgi:heptosyltransferase II